MNPVLVSVSDLQPEKTDMERHAPDPRGQALVEYMVKGAMEAYDKTAPKYLTAMAHHSMRAAFEAAVQERMAQVANTITIEYQLIANEGARQGMGHTPRKTPWPKAKDIIESALGPVKP